MEEHDGNEAAKLTEKAVKGLLATREGCFFLGLVLSRSGVDEPCSTWGTSSDLRERRTALRRDMAQERHIAVLRPCGLLQVRGSLRLRVRGGQGAQGTKGRYFLKRSDNA